MDLLFLKVVEEFQYLGDLLLSSAFPHNKSHATENFVSRVVQTQPSFEFRSSCELCVLGKHILCHFLKFLSWSSLPVMVA